LLWKLHKMIPTNKLARMFLNSTDGSNTGKRLSQVPKPSQVNRLSQDQREVLCRLTLTLKDHGHNTLAQDLDDFLDEDASRHRDLPSTRYKYIMAREVIRAIENGKALQLGCLLSRKKSPYRGIFINEASDDDMSAGDTTDVSYVFTSWKRPAEDEWAIRDIEKYVSIQALFDGTTEKGLMRLRTKNWINGLCFFDKCPRKTEVVFPWPHSLTE